MFLAHQHFGQMDKSLRDAVDANTAIKFAGGVSATVASFMAKQMNTTPEAVQFQPQGTFMGFVKGQTRHAVPVHFPGFVLEQREKATPGEIEELKAYTRESTRRRSPIRNPFPRTVRPTNLMKTWTARSDGRKSDLSSLMLAATHRSSPRVIPHVDLTDDVCLTRRYDPASRSLRSA